MDSNWVNYVGMLTGIIGALTGIAGSIMGYIAYHHSNTLKKSDRLLELGKLRNTVHGAAVGLIELMPKVLASRKAVMNARGVLNSSMMDMFQVQYDKDISRAAELAGSIPKDDVTFDSLSRDELEKHIIVLDRTKRWIDELVSGYQAAIVEDEKMRAEIRAVHNLGIR